MSFTTVAAFKTVKSWGLMQYVNLSYDIGETSKKVLGPKMFFGSSQEAIKVCQLVSTLKSKAHPKNYHELSRYCH